jgi:hypothetical protein
MRTSDRSGAASPTRSPGKGAFQGIVHFRADCSFGKWPRARTALRIRAFTLSIALVEQMRVDRLERPRDLVPILPVSPAPRILDAYP